MNKRMKTLVEVGCPVLLLTLVFLFVIALIAVRNMLPTLLGGADLRTFTSRNEVPNDFDTHTFLDISDLPSDSHEILLAYVGWRDPGYFISFSASAESVRSYISRETKTEFDNLKAGTISEHGFVNTGPLDKMAKPVNHPLWNVQSITNGKIYDGPLRCIIVDTANNRIYDARWSM